MKSLPTGTITFLFTDIEGSTTLLQRLGDRRYAEVLEDHHRLLRDAFEDAHGREVAKYGDAFVVAFSRATDAVRAAVAAQRSLVTHAWPDGASLRVRMGLHTGEAVSAAGDYAGLEVHRASRICSVGHGGQILLSQTVADLAIPHPPAGVSLRDLGSHRLKDLRDPEHLFQVMHPDLPADFPPPKSLDARPNNLPIQLTRFVGREREIVEVKRLLGAARLVTLTGSGGAGKTRLALQVAADVVDDYRDGVWLAGFAPIADAALVPKTVASAMSLPEQPGREITETLVDVLRPKTLLLVLDNCEHLLAACGDLTATLLRTCPLARILATSREGLGVPGETLWRVPSLSMPEDLRHLPSPEELVLYDAVRLFVDRAASNVPEFAVTSDNAPAVVQVCQRLDGIPLAIELAAARVKVLTVEQIVARLDDRFRLLTGGSQVLLPRHQTLRATLDWSYDLLSEHEQILLRRLFVFAGGFTLDAAEQICAGGGIESQDVLDLLTRLVDKSLVVVEPPREEARYRLLETVRQFARDRLVESGETAQVRARHRDWYLVLAERNVSRGYVPVWDPEVLERLERDHENLRAALEWSATEEAGAEPGLRLAGALAQFWQHGGYLVEGRRWLESALARSDAPSAARALALEGASALAWRQADYEPAWQRAQQLAVLGREQGNKAATAQGLMRLGLVVLRRDQDVPRATAFFEESLVLAREIGDRRQIGQVLAQLGAAARHQGHYERAAALVEESLVEIRAVGSPGRVGYVLRLLGHIRLGQGDLERAATLYGESLRSAGVPSFVRIECLEGFASVAAERGHHQRAARLFGAADATRETTGFPRRPPDSDHYERRAAAARTSLGDAAFAAAVAEGRAMTLEQAIEYALAEKTD